MPGLVSTPSPTAPNAAGHRDHRRKEITALHQSRSLSCLQGKAEVSAGWVSLPLYACTHEEMEESILLLRQQRMQPKISDPGYRMTPSTKEYTGNVTRGRDWPPWGTKNWVQGRQTASWQMLLARTELWSFGFPPLPSYRTNTWILSFSPGPISRDDVGSLWWWPGNTNSSADYVCP